MNSELDTLLHEVAEETFDAMVFMLAMPNDDAAVAGPWTAGSVDFAGPFSGTLAVSVQSEMMPALCSNMLGLDEGQPPDEARQADALKELINVICGNLLPQMAGEKAVFEVGAPTYVGEQPAPHELPGDCPTASARLCLDEGIAELRLLLHGQIPQEVLAAAAGHSG